MKQLEDIIGYHVAMLSPKVPLEQQLKSLAFDCYTQGLLDRGQLDV